jgi:hypothetical protein
MEVGGQLHVASALLLGRRPPFRRLGGSQCLSGSNDEANSSLRLPAIVARLPGRPAHNLVPASGVHGKTLLNGILE